MKYQEIIETLEMENELMTFDPHTGEDFDPLYLNDVNKQCYEAHKEAIKILKMLQDITDGKIKKYAEKNLTIYNKEWLDQHRFEMSTLVPSIPVEWVKSYLVKKKEKNKDDCIYWHYFEKDVLEMIEDWKKENEQKSR